MSTEAIVLVPFILAWWMAANGSLQAALFNVYLPVLLLVPDYFRMPIDGLPDPGFGHATILPIGVGLCWLAFVKGQWRYSTLDYWVLAFVAWQFISDFYNVGYKDAQNMLFDTTTLYLFPYMGGKVLIEPVGMRIPFARRFVWLVFVVSLISVYEFRMGNSLFRPLIGPFFPGQSSGAFTQIRWGFGRVAGPYSHAILMCAIVGIGYLLCRWLTQTEQWESHFRWLSSLPFKKSTLLTVGLVAGMFMTLSRGPWLGAACGAVLASIGTNADRRRGLKRAALILVGGGLLLYGAGKIYLSGAGPTDAVEEQASAAYREVLLEQYNTIAMQQPILGWGRANWPQVPGMKSIDNNYLLTALGSGLVGVALLLMLFGVAMWRLFSSGFFDRHMEPADRSFHFTMLGILAGIAISTATVFMGAQLQPLFFLFLGWSEACIVFPPPEADNYPEEEYAMAGYAGVRVVA